MVTYNEYLKNILIQILDSYAILKEIKDNPGDLDNITKELLRINGFLKVINNKIDPYKIPISDFKKLQTRFRYYLENYYFEKEIETIGPLYSNDVHRIKNMRLKILEALEYNKMMDEIEEMIEKL